jgi:Fis family transcriptional regulator
MGVITVARTPAREAPAPERAANAEGAAGSNGSGAQRREGETIEQCILRTLDQYFRDLDGARPHQLHEMVMHAVERPLLRFALDRSSGNQSAAAQLLGINRNTLRKKLIEHGFSEAPPPKPAARRAARGRTNGARSRR